MKIIFAIKRLESMAGGAERVFLQIAHGLKSQGFHIEILSFDKSGSKSFYPTDDIKWHRIPVGDNSKPSNFFETIQRSWKLNRFFKTEKPDLVVAFQHSMMVPVTFSFPVCPVIGSDHIVPHHYKGRQVDFIIAVLSSYLCRKVTVISPTIRKMYPGVIRDRIVPITNPIKISGFKASINQNENTGNTILSVGRLEPQKDPETLIKAFSLLEKEFPDWNLVIKGEGSLRKHLEDMILQLGLTDRIFIPGITKDIEEDYRSSRIFALASIYESFGLATVEAMSFGLPVVGFYDCPGTNDIITDTKNGLLIKPYGKERHIALAEGLKILMSAPSYRNTLGDQGFIDAKKYDITTVLEDWKRLIADVTNFS